MLQWPGLSSDRADAAGEGRGDDSGRPHARYEEELRTASDPLAAAWVAQAEASLTTPRTLPLPSAEAIHLSPLQPEAVAFRFEARHGHRLVVELQALAPNEHASNAIFLDVFASSASSRDWLASGVAGEPLQLEIERDGAYVLRVQPALHVGGEHVLRARLEPSLGFPVANADRRAVASTFGAPRDRGRREHHGIDIFAERGTAALAVTDSTVVEVGTNRLGGNVVWLRGHNEPLVFYYAHLDRALVQRGQRLTAGAAVGEIGNTGNARSTAPHLHFGIYGRGPIDPFPFVAEKRARVPQLAVDTDKLGQWLRVPSKGTRLRAESDSKSTVVQKLERDTPVLLKGARGKSWRVELPDGTSGWLPASKVRDWPQRRFKPSLERVTPLLVAPRSDAPPLIEVEPSTPTVQRATWGEYRLLETATGERGWIGPPVAPGEVAPGATQS